MLPTATALADAGFRSILVDLRGHGRSSGEYLTYGVVEARDVSQLLDALEARGMVLGPVGVHGYSYGGAVAIHLAARDARIAATVAVSAFSSVRGVVRDYLVRYAPKLAPAVSETWLDAAVDLGGQMAEFDPDAAAPARVAPNSKSRILLVHGTLDDQVPAYHADAIERSAPGRVKKLLLPGETHASVLADGAHVVRDAACRWFEKELVRVGARGTRRI
jgi:pimeloyl-ACP methyl ester carboxylesterase